MSNLSQHSLILKMLRKAGSKGIMNYEFAANRILRYSARIKELRSEGYNISTERVKLPNGRSTGVFRYTLIEEDSIDAMFQKIFGKFRRVKQ